jgi:hypothetical protein
MGHRGTIVIAGNVGITIHTILLLAFLSVALTGAAQNANKEATQIRQACVSKKNYAAQHKNDALLFSAVPQNQDPARDRWRRLTSRGEFEAAANNGNSTASAWMRNAKVEFVEAVFRNQFGDSTQSVQYCFRPNGTLAQLHSELKSFHSDLRVVRQIEFDDASKQLLKTTQSFNLTSGQPQKIPADFWDFPPPVFARVSDLPFAKQL